MGDASVSSVGRFSPAPGLFVDRTENKIAIGGAMEMFGPEASGARAQSVRKTINAIWTATFPDGHSVACNVSVAYRPPATAAGDVAQIEALKIAGPSHVSGFDRSMTLNANESAAFTWTAAHEFGHVIGLQDRYSEGILSKIRSRYGGTRATTVDPRYQTNLMAVSGGALESQNLRDLAAENQPSPYWVNDDAQVRDWVNHHPLVDVTGLSTTSKVNMIKTLMGGWISDADMAAIVRICSAVTRKPEADALRTSIDMLGFSSMGQRQKARLAFRMMP